MTSGLPQVSKYRLGVSKGMLPVMHLAQGILMVINYCGCQISRKLGWAAHACHEKDGATPYSGLCRFNLQYDGRPYGRIVVRL